MSQLQQVIVMLPEPLVAFLKRAAEREDRTLSGALRRIVSEAARAEPRPAGMPDAPVLQGVSATPEGVAEAKQRVAAMRQERDELRRRQRKYFGTTLDEDQRCDRLSAEIELTEKHLVLAERLMPAQRKGAQNV